VLCVVWCVVCVCVYPWVHTYMGGVCGGGVCVPLGTYTGARDFKIGGRRLWCPWME